MPSHAMVRSLIVGLALTGLSFTTASAGTCLAEVRALAAEHGIEIDPPNAPKDDVGNGVTSKELSRSRGLIEPPRVNDPAAIEPREGVRYGMPTLPNQPEDGRATTANQRLDPEAQALLASVLISARSEALRDQEEDCFKAGSKSERSNQRYKVAQSGRTMTRSLIPAFGLSDFLGGAGAAECHLRSA